LIALNLVASLAASVDRAVSSELGFDPAQPGVLQALASLFLHGNLLHLLGNLVFLAAVGPAVEFASSGWRVALLYAVGGLAGVGAHWGAASLSRSPSVLLGASSAVAALAGFAALRFSRVRVPLAPGIGAQVGWVAVAWVLLQAAGGFVSFGKFGGVSYVGHLAGFLSGVAMALLASAHGAESKDFGHSVLDQMNSRGPGAVLAASDALLRKDPNDLKALLARADALGSLGEPAERQAALARVALAGFGPESRTALLSLIEAGAADQVPAHVRMRFAETEEDRSAACRILASIVDEPAQPARPDALLALARLQEGAERSGTLRILEREYALHGATETARRLGLLP
jgi:membrane associated rhomboid family serine protease